MADPLLRPQEDEGVIGQQREIQQGIAACLRLCLTADRILPGEDGNEGLVGQQVILKLRTPRSERA